MAAPLGECLAVGSPGNRGDRNGYGAVPYAFRITKSRITNQEYTAFLNSVDASASNERALYHAEMATSPRGGIDVVAENADGSKYVVQEGRASQPVLLVEWSDAARYANWLCNGATHGASTEKGAYDLVASNGQRTARSENAKYWIPNENEWYKAAFYQTGADGKAKFARRTLWHDSIRAGVMGEIVDASPPKRELEPVAENVKESPVRFSCSLPSEMQDEAKLQGFRVSSLVEARDGKQAKALAPVAEGPLDVWDPIFDPLYYPIWWFQPVVVENSEDPSS